MSRTAQNRRQNESHKARLNGRGAKEEGKAKGCGCQTGVLRFARLPYAQLFYAACCLHDDDYDRGGNDDARRQADMRLYQNCAKIALKRTHSPTHATWLTLMAWLYYVSVRIFGGQYFNKA